MDRRLTIAGLVLPLLLSGCGDDGDSGGSGEESSPPDPTSSLSPDEAAIHQTLVDFSLEPRCDLATEEYLLERALLSETPAEACQELEDTWIEPQYEADDIEISEIQVDGDTATAVLGSDPDYVETNITVTYELTKVDGEWLISCDDFACDHL